MRRRIEVLLLVAGLAGCRSDAIVAHRDTAIAPPPRVELDIGPDREFETGTTNKFVATEARGSGTLPVAVRAAWISRDTAVATIDTAGVASFRKPGRSTIVATADGLSDSLVVTVDAPPELYVTPDTNAIPLGMSRDLHAQTFSSRTGVSPAANAVWSSSNESVALVDAHGHVSSVALGRALITAVSGSRTATAEIDVVPNDHLVFSQVAMGLFYTACGLTADGRLYCWGDLSYRADPSRPIDHCESISLGELLAKERTIRRCTGTPVLMSNLRFSRIVQVMDYSHLAVFALTADGQLHEFGLDADRQPTNMTVLDVAAQYHTCIVAADRQLYCWGYNIYGQLGIGTAQRTGPFPETPLLVSPGQTWSAVSATETSTCALTTDGRAYCWGDNGGYRLGIGLDSTTAPGCISACVTRPAPVATDQRFVSIASTGLGTCALTADGAVYCWGQASFRMMQAHTATGAPVAMPDAPHFTRFVAGNSPCGIDANGTVYCLKRNDTATSNADLFSFAAEPLPFPVLTFTASIASGCAVSAVDRHTYCWGDGSMGHLGDGSFMDAPETRPVLVGNQATP